MRFNLNKFEKQGEKTGWTYIEFSEEFIQKLNPESEKHFELRVKLTLMNLME